MNQLSCFRRHSVHSNLRRIIRSLLRIVRASAVWSLDSVCLLIPYSPRDCAVVVRLDAIGDFFVWMQSGAVGISEYVRQLGLRSILIANSNWGEFAKTSGLWDQVISIDSARFNNSIFYRVRQIALIRRIGASCLIQPRAARLFLMEDAIARISGASRRVGSSGTLLNTTNLLRRIGNEYYSELIDVRGKEFMHETLRNQRFVRGLTGHESEPFVFQRVTPSRMSSTIVVALGAGEVGRIWPIEKLAVLLRHANSAHPTVQIVIVGRSSDAPAAQRLVGLLEGVVSNQVGRTGLSEYIDIIAGATVVICNESSAYHIAMAFKRAVLCLVGGGHYGLFAPYPESPQADSANIVVKNTLDCFGCNWRCRYPREENGVYRCVATIDVEEAIEGFETLFARVMRGV